MLWQMYDNVTDYEEDVSLELPERKTFIEEWIGLEPEVKSEDILATALIKAKQRKPQFVIASFSAFSQSNIS